ncbi:MAG: dihydropteroate synthase [Acidobacteria bacterium]|nr:dihydropteroate synthase [Acidobacteriota bacterium]
MGILNVTPDSFADANHCLDPDTAVAAALRLEADGADLIDVGGESTRPGADPVPASEELRRVRPVLDALRGRLRVPVSIDTYKSEVAAEALAAGAALVNDVSGLDRDPALARVVADAGAALILMHSRGPATAMYAQASYGDIVADVAAELRDSIGRAAGQGVPRDRIILDPGVGFAKRAAHSYGVLARLPELAAALDRPLLVGPSRKSFMRDAVGDRPAPERDWGTAAAVTAAVMAGAHILRVHAVAEMAQVVRVAEEIRRHG